MADASMQMTVLGLRDFQRALGHMAGDLPTSLREYNIRAAEEIVEAGKARATTPQAHKAAEGSLRASKASSYVAVMLGDNRRYAFARGSEWGARRYRQFPPWRGNQWMSWGGGPGYFLHPAIREVGTRVIEEYWESIRHLWGRAFPE